MTAPLDEVVEQGRGLDTHGGPPSGGTRPLRIVLVSYACDPSRGTEPGLGWAWAEAMARRGHTVELLTHPDRGSERHIAQRITTLGPIGRRINVHLVPVPPCPAWIRFVPRILRHQVSEFLRYDGWQRAALDHARHHRLSSADLVHHVSYGSMAGGSALRRLGPPLVFGPVGGGQTAPHSHRRFMGGGFRHELIRELLWVRGLSHRPTCRATLREAAIVLATNRDTVRRANRLGRRSDVRLTLADGVPEQLVRTVPEYSVPQGARTPTVLWVGRLMPFKAPELALRAFVSLRSEMPDARLVLLGDGPLRDELERIAARSGVADSVHFQGHVPWEEALAAYDDADVMLFTSLRDSSGVQTLEAWSRGLPVVHLAHQGIGDFSAPGGAIPVPLGDPAGLPDRLAEALGSVLADQEKRLDMGAAGLQWARRHTWTAKAELVEQLYRTVLDRRESSAESAEEASC